MPKAKPTQVITHRIEAGQWERDNILRPVATVARNAKYVSTAAVTVVCVGVGMAGYSAYWFLKKTSQWAHEAGNLWDMTIGKTDDVVTNVSQGKPAINPSQPWNSPFTPLFQWVGGLLR